MDAAGTRVAWASPDELTVYLLNLTDPPAAGTLALKRYTGLLEGHALDPVGRWLTAGYRNEVRFCPLRSAWSRVLSGQPGSPVYDLAFSPGMRWLASSAYKGTTRLWRMRSQPGEAPYVDCGSDWSTRLAYSPDGQTLLVGSDRLVQYSLETHAPTRVFEGGPPGAILGGRAFDPTGRFVVAGPAYAPRPEGRVLQLWDVQLGDFRAIPLPQPRPAPR